MRCLIVLLGLSFGAVVASQSQTPSLSLTKEQKNRVNEALQGLHDAAATTQQMLLYHIDHQLLASEARAFATGRDWGSGHVVLGTPGQTFTGDDTALPLSIRILQPSSVFLRPDRIEIEFGGALHHQGISVFRGGNVGEGTKKLDEGVWYYSEGDKIFDGPTPKI